MPLGLSDGRGAELDAKADVVARITPWNEARRLKYIGERIAGEARRLSCDFDGAVRRFDQSADHPNHSRFAAAAGAQQADEFVFNNGE